MILAGIQCRMKHGKQSGKSGTKMGHQLDVKQVMLYSARADVSHVYLNPTHDGDVKRALDVVTRFDKQLHLSSGCPMWISVHKPPAVRYRNKSTGNVLGKIKSLLGMPPRERNDRINISWRKQIVWVDNARVVACDVGELRKDENDMTQTHAVYDATTKEETCFHVNVMVLAEILGLSCDEVTQKVSAWSEMAGRLHTGDAPGSFDIGIICKRP